MNPGYMRIKLSKTTAMERFKEWLNKPEIEPPKLVSSSNSVDEACNQKNEWRGIAVFIHEKSGWTIFQDLTGFLASFSAKQWMEFAKNDELVLAGYNDAIPYGQLIVISGNRILRDFLDDKQYPDDNINYGKLDREKERPISSWIEAASFVDDDELGYVPDEGTLWIFEKPF